MLAKCANPDCSEHLRGNDFLPRSHSRYTNHRCMSDSGSAPALLLVITSREHVIVATLRSQTSGGNCAMMGAVCGEKCRVFGR
jgi:hypothetical protein